MSCLHISYFEGRGEEGGGGGGAGTCCPTNSLLRLPRFPLPISNFTHRDKEYEM